jgi:hypothetical protein
MPWELWMGILCEEFPGRLPTEILAEERRLPTGLLDTIVLYRSYKRAKRMLDEADTAERREALPKSSAVRPDRASGTRDRRGRNRSPGTGG